MVGFPFFFHTLVAEKVTYLIQNDFPETEAVTSEKLSLTNIFGEVPNGTCPKGALEFY